MSEDYTLDEIREERWEQMQHEARMYCRKNQYKIDKLAERLSMPRSTQQKATDWMKTKRITMDSWLPKMGKKILVFGRGLELFILCLDCV